MEKRYSQACENNKTPILSVLTDKLKAATNVLEIGSGTGQHSVYFAELMDWLTWQTSDMPVNHPSILAWGLEANLPNWQKPYSFTLGVDGWPENSDFDAVFSANTAHIMQKDEVRQMMQLIAKNLPSKGLFCQYGPFKFDGEFTSDSNAAFDSRLRSEGYGGYRDISELKEFAETNVGRLRLLEVIDMPANNHLLFWEKEA